MESRGAQNFDYFTFLDKQLQINKIQKSVPSSIQESIDENVVKNSKPIKSRKKSEIHKIQDSFTKRKFSAFEKL